MKIAYLLGGFKTNGGIGRVTSIIANSLVGTKGIEVITISLFNIDQSNLYQLSPSIKEFYLFPNHITMKSALLKGGSAKLRKILKSEKVDILIACGALYFPMAILSAMKLSTKVISWEHSNANNISDHVLQKESRYVGARFSDAIVTLTKHDQNLYKNKYKIDQVHQIYNPVDASIEAYTKEYNVNSHKIISVGRLTYQKYFQNLIEVARKVFQIHPNWIWNIYGEGEDRSELEDLIQQYNLFDRVNLKGQVSNLYSLYPDYSFQVMTSRYEGFPMSLLEGMTHTLPLISYDVETGPNEIIDHGVNGFLIEPFDIDAMSQAIITLIEQPEIRINMSQKNKELKEFYQLTAIINEWICLFDNLVE